MRRSPWLACWSAVAYTMKINAGRNAGGVAGQTKLESPHFEAVITIPFPSSRTRIWQLTSSFDSTMPSLSAMSLSTRQAKVRATGRQDITAVPAEATTSWENRRLSGLRAVQRYKRTSTHVGVANMCERATKPRRPVGTIRRHDKQCQIAPATRREPGPDGRWSALIGRHGLLTRWLPPRTTTTCLPKRSCR